VAFGSAYGLFANQTASITLEAVNVHAAIGVPGANGSLVNTTGPNECYAGNGAMGATGNVGGPANAIYGLTGYVPNIGLSGVQGDAGGGGGAGGMGATGTCPSCDSGFGMDGSMIFFTCTDTGGKSTMGNPGSAGCGGGGGAGGTGGAGAGASIAVYVTGGNLVIKSGTKLTTSIAATGGNGGDGTPGANGSAGVNGSPFVSGAACMGMMCGSVQCLVDGGQGGTAGGKGGSGGQGGGGGGGASVTLVRRNNVAVTIYDGSAFGFQLGGDGGSPNGQAGDQVPEITFP
jgi:hypothetical protein